MTRLELLTILIRRARANGFEFRRWYSGRLGLPWISSEAAIALLEQQRRYYALVFAHEFALAFWKAGEEIHFTVPGQTYRRRLPDGSIGTVVRKPFQRRSARQNAWLYHLREMAAAEDPLRYLRRYLNLQDDLVEERPPSAREPLRRREKTGAKPGPKPKPIAHPIPTDPPGFLRGR
jgi:hypothetical protein